MLSQLRVSKWHIYQKMQQLRPQPFTALLSDTSCPLLTQYSDKDHPASWEVLQRMLLKCSSCGRGRNADSNPVPCADCRKQISEAPPGLSSAPLRNPCVSTFALLDGSALYSHGPSKTMRCSRWLLKNESLFLQTCVWQAKEALSPQR